MTTGLWIVVVGWVALAAYTCGVWDRLCTRNRFRDALERALDAEAEIQIARVARYADCPSCAADRLIRASGSRPPVGVEDGE